MVIDGNDDRGIDVGILTKPYIEVVSIASHVDDTDEEGQIFSRDYPEYTVRTPSGNLILILINHLKSQGFGETSKNGRKRKRQSTRVRAIYEERLKESIEYIAITGDLNIDPSHDSLQPLLGNGSSLIDITLYPKFKSDGLPWTYKTPEFVGKLDYILLSPKLQYKVISAGIERRGVWGGENREEFHRFPEVKEEIDAASDHAALWVELDL